MIQSVPGFPYPDLSVVIVSFNTSSLLRECLRTLFAASAGLAIETFVVDNASRDGSPDMVAAEFPQVHLIRCETNLGFGAANNRAFSRAAGRYIVLLNSDAFVREGALQRSWSYLEAHRDVGLAGARLVGRDDSWQPSARLFPSVLNELLTMSGLPCKFPQSRFFGRVDRTWADQNQVADVDWVPGAFSIIRREALIQVGYFDESFFLYYEEVDLCRRIKAAGYRIVYLPYVVVEHIGGESAKSVTHLTRSKSGAQLTLWSVQSQLLYYRKHHGLKAWVILQIGIWWHRLRAWKNRFANALAAQEKLTESRERIELMRRAWRATSRGNLSPERPW